MSHFSLWLVFNWPKIGYVGRGSDESGLNTEVISQTDVGASNLNKYHL